MSTVRCRRLNRTSLLIAVLSVVSMVAMSTPSLGAMPVMWSDPVMIATDGSRDVTVDGDSFYVNGFEKLTASHDLGVTWGSQPSVYSRICAEGGKVYRASPIGEYYDATIFFDTSVDDGVTWSEQVPIVTLEGRNDGSYGIFKFGSRLVLYTMDGGPGGNDPGAMVKVLWSDDEGTTWGGPVIVDEGLYFEDPFPNDIVCANGVLYMTYSDNEHGYDNIEIIVAKSTNMGETWTNVVAAEGPIAHDPVIAADPITGEIHVTYLSGIVLPDWTLVDYGPHYIKSMDGVSWSAPVRVGTITSGTDHVSFHSLVASGGMVFEGYLDYKGPDLGDSYNIRISCSLDDGATWSDMGDVTGLVSNAVFPMVVIASDKLHFFWTDFGSGDPWYDYGNTYYRSMQLGGTVFGEVVVVRQAHGNPAKDAKTLSFTPEKDGSIWVNAVGSKLSVLRMDVYEKGVGKPTLLSTQIVVLGWRNTNPVDSSMVEVLAGHEYVVKLTPYGMVGGSAEVTGLYAAG